MKKFALLLVMSYAAICTYAQDPGAAEKNAGNAAWKAKNYAEAFANFEKYLQIVNYNDKAYIYNTAVAADKSNNATAAEKYFDMAIKKNYKVANSYLGKAQAQKDLKKEVDMLATLEEGLKAAPANAKLENMYGTYFLNKGIESQKGNDVNAAAANFEKITKLVNPEMKTKALTALASLFFNNGAGILQKASSFANTEKEKYAAEKENAISNFKKALGYATQALATSPESAEAKDIAKQIKDAMK